MITHVITGILMAIAIPLIVTLIMADQIPILVAPITAIIAVTNQKTLNPRCREYPAVWC